MKKKHKFFSNLAVNLANNHLGKTSTNPSVGCIIVKDYSVVSSGVTSISGRPHAEFNALNKKMNFKGSDMYVSLEPCVHYGLTPPCTKIIKSKKIKNVYYNFDDPDLRTYRKSKEDLKKKGINLKKVTLTHNNFYKSYYLNKFKKLPFLDAKIAISKDFNTINTKNKRITNERSETVTHYIRSKYDAIISTSKTINRDDALLNCRINGLDNFKPDLLIIDRFLKLKKKLKFLDLTKKRKTYIFTLSNNEKKIAYFKSKNCKVININRLQTKNDFLKLFDIIFKLGKRRILVEAGLIFLKRLLELKIINEVFIFKSNIKLAYNGYNNISPSFLKKFKLKKSERVNLLNDKLYKIKV